MDAARLVDTCGVGPSPAPVSTQDAKLIFEFITRRLVERDASGDTRGAVRHVEVSSNLRTGVN